MMVNARGSVLGLLAWQWRWALLFTASATAAQLTHALLGWRHLELPTLPLAVVGGAIGIFASFRSNAGYARWWEARQLWGRLVNSSRHLASLALTAAPGDEARAMVRRQIAWAHVLRCTLRHQDPWADPDVLAWTTEAEREAARADRNAAYAILHGQYESVARMVASGAASELRAQSLEATLAGLLDVQGGCERIERTPFPRAYGFIAERLIIAYGCMLPFALVKDLGWVAVPVNLLVCGAFTLISEVGRVLEDPFTMFWNGLPLSAMSKTVELNLRQRMGERDVPAAPQPDARGILM